MYRWNPYCISFISQARKSVFIVWGGSASGVVYGMPMVAHEIGAVCAQASCADIAGVLIRHLKALH